jgi:CubicO group peptidase (beta-lactamase class C family)
VETVTGMRLGDYMQKNIWGPLGMTSTTFRIEESKNSNIKSRLVDMTVRLPTGELMNLEEPPFSRTAPDDCGGVGAYSSAPDYIKLLLSITKDDGKLLKSETIDEMFKPQLPDPKYLAEVLKDPLAKAGLAGIIPEGIKLDYGLGGMINVDPMPGMRAAGSMQWGGLPCLYWVSNEDNSL